MKEKVILTLFKHVHWGYVLQPIWVEDTSGSLNVLNIVSEQSSCFSTLTDVQQQIIRYSGCYTDEVLMKSFSKERTVFDFYKTVKPNTVEHCIRPTIEQYHSKIIALLCDSGLELYHRAEVKKRILYAYNQIHYLAEPAHVVFHFIRDDISDLRYFIRVKHKDRAIELKDKEYAVLCHEPAVVAIDNELFVFDDIDSKKLLPFFTKDFVSVPATSEQAYIKKFVVNCVRNYEVIAEGLSVVEVAPQKKACLSLEKDPVNHTKLLLEFEYEEKKYNLNDKCQRIVTSSVGGVKTRIEWFGRDAAWEKSIVALLEEHGLKQDQAGYFMVADQDSSSERELIMIHWLQTHTEFLDQFYFDRQISDKNISRVK